MWGQHIEKKRVLILGGGFGGVATAQRLRHHFKKDSTVEITLVNRENFFVFIPLLASAASGSIIGNFAQLKMCAKSHFLAVCPSSAPVRGEQERQRVLKRVE